MRGSRLMKGSTVLLSAALVAGAATGAQAQNGARYPGVERGREGAAMGQRAGAVTPTLPPGFMAMYPATGPIPGTTGYGTAGAYGVPPTAAYGMMGPTAGYAAVGAPTAALGVAPTAAYGVAAGYGAAVTERLGPILGEPVWQFIVPPPRQVEWTYVPITELRQVTRQVPVTQVVQVPRVHHVTRPVQRPVTVTQTQLVPVQRPVVASRIDFTPVPVTVPDTAVVQGLATVPQTVPVQRFAPVPVIHPVRTAALPPTAVNVQGAAFR